MTSFIQNIKNTTSKICKGISYSCFHSKKMSTSILQPPEAVKGMRDLKRDAFVRHVEVTSLRVKSEYANLVLSILKDKLLKMPKLKPVRDSQSVNVENSDVKELLLHPDKVDTWDSLPTEKLNKFNVCPADFCINKVELTYDNFRADEILGFVLSAEKEGLTSYSRIGHIIHLNLRDHLVPYKKLIAQVFADKLSGIRTVVNKTSNIDNTYRNFELELLYGEPEYQVETKENGISYEFDFSRVYWNPRLSTEHERIVQMLKPNDVVYDVFAGVGPFSVPAAKKKCWVLANDLNPESFKWLTHNLKRNKCSQYAQVFNKDGRAFILEDIRTDLLKRWQEDEKKSTNQSGNASYNIHVVMNLPAIAVEFLNAFRGLLQSEEISKADVFNNKPLLVHVYTFAKGLDTKAIALDLVEQHLMAKLNENLKSISFVRNVAPNKDMYRISFYLTKQLLTTYDNDTNLRKSKRIASDEINENELPVKQPCIS